MQVLPGRNSGATHASHAGAHHLATIRLHLKAETTDTPDPTLCGLEGHRHALDASGAGPLVDADAHLGRCLVRALDLSLQLGQRANSARRRRLQRLLYGALHRSHESLGRHATDVTLETFDRSLQGRLGSTGLRFGDILRGAFKLSIQLPDV